MTRFLMLVLLGLAVSGCSGGADPDRGADNLTAAGGAAGAAGGSGSTGQCSCSTELALIDATTCTYQVPVDFLSSCPGVTQLDLDGTRTPQTCFEPITGGAPQGWEFTSPDRVNVVLCEGTCSAASYEVVELSSGCPID